MILSFDRCVGNNQNYKLILQYHVYRILIKIVDVYFPEKMKKIGLIYSHYMTFMKRKTRSKMIIINITGQYRSVIQVKV